MKSDMDNREWLDDFESLRQVGASNPFLVPSGYFDELAQHITSRVRLEELKSSADGFTIPENYFEQLSSNIQSRVNIEAALGTEETGFTTPPNFFDEQASQIMSRIAIEQYVNNEAESFTVPENYFEEMDENIQSRVAIEEYLDSQDEGFAVPENYFDELSSNIQSRIAVEELMNSQADDFTVPANYFEQLSQNILNKTVNQAQEADVVEAVEVDNVISFKKAVDKRSVIRKMLASGTFRYATAACFAVILGITVVLKGTAPVDHNHSFLHEQVSSVPVDEIKSYLELHSDASDTRTLIDANQKSNSSNSDEALSDYIDAN
jgi:hypothetical protein